MNLMREYSLEYVQRDFNRDQTGKLIDNLRKLPNLLLKAYRDVKDTLSEHSWNQQTGTELIDEDVIYVAAFAKELYERKMYTPIVEVTTNGNPNRYVLTVPWLNDHPQIKEWGLEQKILNQLTRIFECSDDANPVKIE